MAKSLSEMSTEELLALRKSLTSGLGSINNAQTPSEEIDFRDYSAGNALTRALGRGVDVVQTGYGSALEGLGKLSGLEGLEQYGEEVVAEQKREQAKKAPFATRLQDVKDAEGVLGTAGALASFTGSALGESLPQMGTTLGGSFAGAAAGARAGMVAGLPGAVVGGIAGGLLANVPFFYGMNREAQKEAIEQGYRTEMSEGAAFIASLPAAAMDLVVDRLLVGLGPKAGANIEQLSRRGGLFTRGAKGAGLGAAVEIPTELGQQLLERYQAGLPIDSPEAIDEYIEVMAAAGLVGGSIRGATNVVSGDPKVREEKEKEIRKQAKKAEELKRQKDAEAEEQRKIEAIASGTATQGDLFDDLAVDESIDPLLDESVDPLLDESVDPLLDESVDPSLTEEIKILRRNLEQYKVDDATVSDAQLELGAEATEKTPTVAKQKFEYADPTAGLKPELAIEKDELVDKIYDLKINTPPDADAETLSAIEEEIKIKEQRIADINEEIDIFVKQNRKQINQERKRSKARLNEIKENNPAALGVFPKEVVGYETVGGKQVSLLDIPLVEQDAPKAPLVFAQGTTGIKLIESGQYTEEDFKNPRYLKNVKGNIKESGLNEAQIGQIKKNIDNDRKANIVFEDLSNRTQEFIEPAEQGSVGDLSFVETMESFKNRLEDNKEPISKILNDLRRYQNKVEKRENKILETQGEESIKKQRDRQFEVQGFLYKEKTKTKDGKTPSQLSIDKNLSKEDIITYGKKENIDLKNIGIKDINKIAAAKTKALKKEAKRVKIQKNLEDAKKVAKDTEKESKKRKKKTEKKAKEAKEDAKAAENAEKKLEDVKKAAKNVEKELEGRRKKTDKRKVTENVETSEDNTETNPNKPPKGPENAAPKEEPIKTYFTDRVFEAYKEYKAQGKMPFTYEDFKELEEKKLIEVTKTGKITKSTLNKLVKRVENIRKFRANAEQDVLNVIGKTDIDLLEFTEASKENPSGSYGELNKLEGQESVAIEALKADMIDATPNNVEVLKKAQTNLKLKKSHGLDNKNFGVVGQRAEGASRGIKGSESNSPFKLAFPYTGNKFGLNFFNSLDPNQQLEIIKDVIEARTPIVELKTKVKTRKVVDYDIGDKATELEKEIKNLQDNIDSAKEIKNTLTSKKPRTEKERKKIEKEIKDLNKKIAELDKEFELKTTEMAKLIGYADFPISKEEKKANDLDEIRNMAALELGQTLNDIANEQKKAGFEVEENKKILDKLRKEEETYKKAYKEADEAYVDFVEKTTTKEGKYIEDNPLVGTRHGVLTDEKRGLQYLKKASEGMQNSLQIAPEKPPAYSIPFEEKVYPKTTIEKIKTAVLEKFGKIGLNRIIVAKNPKRAGLKNIESTAAGVVIDNKVYLFADNIAEGNELGVLLHELGVHVGMPALVGQGNYKFLISKIKQFANANDGSRESQLAKRALDRVRQAEKIVDVNKDDELIAYFVEEAVNSGINPTVERTKKSFLGTWFRRFIAGAKNLLNKLGFKFKANEFNAQELVDIAYGGADFAIRNPNIKFTNAEKAIQYSVATPLGNAKNLMNNTFSNIHNAAPVWSQNTIDNVLNGVSNLPDYFKKVVYNLLSLRQMADTIDRFGEKYRPIADGIRKLNDIVNERRFKIDQTRLKFQDALLKAQSHKEGYTQKDLDEFYEIVHESTIEEIDLRSNASDVTSTDLYKRYMKVVNKSSDLSKYDLRKAYKILADEYANAGQRLLDFYQKSIGETLSDKQKRELGFITNASGKIVPYFPLVRSGSWWVDFKVGDEIFTLAYENKREAEQAVKKLEKDPEVSIQQGGVYQRVRGGENELNDSTSSLKVLNAVQKALEDALQPGPDKSEAIRQIKDTILKAYPAQSLKNQFKKRKGIKGFRQDVFQNFAEMSLKYSNELSLLDNVDDINNAIGAIENFGGEGKIPPGVANILASLQKRSKFLLNPTPGVIASRFAWGGYTWFILGNISSALINLTQIPLVTYGLLAGEFGITDAAGAIKDGFKDYFKFHKDDNTTISFLGLPLADRTAFGGKFIDESTAEGREMKTLFDTALAKGIIRRTTSQELQEAKFNRVDSVTGRMLKTEMALGYVFQNSERANREVSLLAAYRLAKKKYKDTNVAMERAFEIVEQANGPALAEAGPQLFQDSFGKVIGTFKRFALSQLYLQYKLLRDINPFIKQLDKDPKVPEGAPSARALALRQYAIISGSAYLFAGAKGVPLYGIAEVAHALAQKAFGDEEDELGLNFNMKVRKFMGDMSFKGPLSHYLNIDLAGRTGFYGLMYRDDPYRRAEIGDLPYFMEALGGPAVAAFYRNPTKAIEKYEAGDLYGAIQTAVPSFIRNGMKGFALATEGAVNSKGVPIVEDISAYSTMMQILGFTPNQLANAYQANEFLSRQSRKLTDRKSKLLLELNIAKTAGDIDGELRILEDIDKFNSTDVVQNAGIGIFSSTIRKSFKNFNNYIEDSVRGLRLPRKTRDAVIEQTGIEDPIDM